MFLVEGLDVLDLSAEPADSPDVNDLSPSPRSRPLSVAAQMLVAALKAGAARINEQPDELTQRISDARCYGLSWDLIGCSLGITGHAARHRFDVEQPARRRRRSASVAT